MLMSLYDEQFILVNGGDDKHAFSLIVDYLNGKATASKICYDKKKIGRSAPLGNLSCFNGEYDRLEIALLDVTSIREYKSECESDNPQPLVIKGFKVFQLDGQPMKIDLSRAWVITQTFIEEEYARVKEYTLKFEKDGITDGYCFTSRELHTAVDLARAISHAQSESDPRSFTKTASCETMYQHAFDILTKPFDAEKLGLLEDKGKKKGDNSYER